jgi:nitrite reductase (NO-forming)
MAEAAPTTEVPAAPAVNVKPFQVYDATLPAIGVDRVKKVHWDSTDEVIYIAKDVAFQAWTFGGSVPGPILALNEGDEVQFSVTNKGSAPHSIDFHAALTPPSKNYISIAPQALHQFTWKAQYPGCFMYHCGTPYVLHHMGMGMYGATIVKPKTGLRPADREYVLVQSEFYLTAPANGLTQTDLAKALSGIPDHVVFNGYVEQYKETPLRAKVGELVRIWLMNAGPTHYSAFHVIGTIFDAAYQDGNPANKMVGMQTVNVYPGGGMMVEFRIPEAGSYPFVSHSFADASKGALGVLTVTNS